MNHSPGTSEKSASDLMREADALAEAESYDQAMAKYSAALKAAPEDAAYTMRVGSFLLKRGEFEKAYQVFQKAAFYEPQNAVAFSLMGLVLIRLGRFDEAEVSLKRAIELNPYDQNSQMLLSGLSEEKDSWDGVLRAVETLMMILNFADQPQQLKEILARVDSNLLALVKANALTARNEANIDLADNLDELAQNFENIIARRILED